MRTKLIIVLVAVALGGVAAVMAARYLSDARADVASESKPIEVLVAAEDIPRGANADELVAKKLVVLEEVPRRFTSAGAISTGKAIQGMVLATPLAKGQQLTAEQFQMPQTAGLAFSIPKQFMALTIPVDEVKGVGGLLKPGDRIALYATFSPGPGGEKDLTKLLLADAKVLAVGASMTSESQGGGDETDQRGVVSSRGQKDEAAAASAITVAITPADAERVIFAEETGEVWCALLPATTEQPPTGAGQSIRTIFR